MRLKAKPAPGWRLVGWSGYHFSVLRGSSAEPFSDVLAAAGSDPGFFSSTEQQSDNEDYRISQLNVFSNVARRWVRTRTCSGP